MKKKILILASSTILTVACIGAAVINNKNSNYFLSKATGDYTLVVNSPLYTGEGQSGVGYTTVRTNNGNEVKVKYNKLNSFADGINNIEKGSYIEIINNGDIHGIAGLSNVTISLNVNKNNGVLRVSYGWDEGVMINTLEQTTNYTSANVYSFDLPNSPSYVRIDSDEIAPTYSYDFDLKQISFTYSCATPVDPYVTGDYVLNFEGDHFEVARYKGTNKHLTFPSAYGDYPITAIADNFVVDMGKEDVEYVSLPSSIKRIGREAFFGAENLKVINLNNVEEIAYRAFFNCYKLGDGSTFDIYASTIGEEAFTQSGLTSVSIHSDTGSVLLYTKAFSNNFSLTSATFDSNITITSGNQVFINCSKLSQAALPVGINSFFMYDGTPYITNNEMPSNMFWECTSLSSLSYGGTSTQWNNITKDSSWNHNVPATYIRCSDVDVPL